MTKGMKAGSAEDMGAQLATGRRYRILLRLLEARYDGLYQSMTRQTDITPRQFGLLMALYQLGPLTPSVLADRISCDRNTLSEMPRG